MTILSRKRELTERTKAEMLSVSVEEPDLEAISEAATAEAISYPETDEEVLAAFSRETDLRFRVVDSSKVVRDLSIEEAADLEVLTCKG